MTETQEKALALVNEVRKERGRAPYSLVMVEEDFLFIAIERAIEQHDVFRQEVSDAVEKHKAGMYLQDTALDRFIIAKPDPLVEAIKACDLATLDGIEDAVAHNLRAAIEKRGGKIVWEDK